MLTAFIVSWKKQLFVTSGGFCLVIRTSNGTADALVDRNTLFAASVV